MNKGERIGRTPQEKSGISESDFLKFLEQQQRKFIRRGHPTENLEEALNRFREKQVRRRSLLKFGLGLGGGLILGDQLPRLPEAINPEPPKIVFPRISKGYWEIPKPQLSFSVRQQFGIRVNLMLLINLFRHLMNQNSQSGICVMLIMDLTLKVPQRS